MTRKGLQYVAVLDLKASYPSEPRDRLMSLLWEQVPSYLATMIGHFLSVDLIRTFGGPGEWMEQDGGVLQGSPLSTLVQDLHKRTGKKIVGRRG